MTIQLPELIKHIPEAKVIGSTDLTPVDAVSIDSRTTEAGTLFVAIMGPKYNGHDFIDQAMQKGASVLMVSQKQDVKIPQIIVPDTTLALGHLAKAHRQTFNIPVLAITGSCGKTGTKTMVSSILSYEGPTLSTLGNFNNQYGVPLTLLRLNTQHLRAVIEVGTSQPGEIEYLCDLVKPTHSLITNINPSHLGGFNSLEDIAHEKAKVYAHLIDHQIAIVNLDEPYARLWAPYIGTSNKVSFSQSKKEADVVALSFKHTPKGLELHMKTPIGELELNIPMLGHHVLKNALASTALALAAGASLSSVKKGLSQSNVVSNRFEPTLIRENILLINDTYNASFGSFESAILWLKEQPGQKILIAGQMSDLGEHSNQLHFALGKLAGTSGIDQLLLLGDRSALKHMQSGFGGHALLFDNVESLAYHLEPLLDQKTAIVVKGSRASRMERVVEYLKIKEGVD